MSNRIRLSLLVVLATWPGCSRERAASTAPVAGPAAQTAAPEAVELAATETDVPSPGPLPAQAEELERLAASIPSDQFALDAVGRLRALYLGRLARLIEARAAQARTAGRRDDARLLALEQERYEVMALGAAFPAFLREPPPVFAVPAGDKVRVLAFGDFGTGKPAQHTVARQIGARHARQRFDLAITLGDNFYPRGMSTPGDVRWQTQFEELYGPLGIPFFATLGNHDWIHPDSPAAEILHDGPARHWRMPASHYTFTAGPVQFFALDTSLLAPRQLAWLDTALRESHARWKIVYGHHPIRSHGAHGDSRAAVERLLPLLRKRVQLYVAGHEHDLQRLRAEDGVHFVIAGGGGQDTRPITPGPRSLFAASRHGFAEIEADAQSLTVTLIGDQGEVLHTFTLPESAVATP